MARGNVWISELVEQPGRTRDVFRPHTADWLRSVVADALRDTLDETERKFRKAMPVGNPTNVLPMQRRS